MRHPFYIFLFFVLVCSLQAQHSSMNNALKMRLYQGASSELLTILVEGNIDLLKTQATQKHLRVNYSKGTIASVTCDLSTLAKLIENKIIYYAEFIEPGLKRMNDTMQVRNRIKAVRTGQAPLSQAYDGSGIVIGFIDTGIDFAHPDFKDAQGKSRIKYLWDQVPVSGSSVPSPFNYGIEWTSTQIDANQCTHSDMAYYGHGTHVAGIAAGNGLANGKHEGCAPKADIIVVALDFNKTGPVISDAVQYIFDKATLLGKPCVINASVGDYYGSHDGTNLEAKLIDNMVQNIPGRALVASAGNSGNYKYHVKTQSTSADTVFTWLNNGGSVLEYWCYGDLAQMQQLKLSIGANRSNFSDLGRIGFKNYNYALSSVKSDTLTHNGNRIGIIQSSSSINTSGVYELYLNILADTANLNWRIESTGNGVHHAWNFDFVGSPLPTPGQYPKITQYVLPDSMYTVVSSFQCSDEVITVGNYFNLSHYYDVHDTLRNNGYTAGAIAQNSSSGPTRDGRIKPDVTASGNFIFSAMPMAMQAAQIAVEPSAVAQGSFHIRGGGTSAAAPVVTGLAALFLQAHPNATNQQIKESIIECTYSDGFTGTQLPNNLWGYGKLDGKAAMLCKENLVHVSSLSRENKQYAYPNPFTHEVTLRFDETSTSRISVYTVNGQVLFEDDVHESSYTLRAKDFNFPYQGLLLVRILGANANYSLKLIKE